MAFRMGWLQKCRKRCVCTEVNLRETVKTYLQLHTENEIKKTQSKYHRPTVRLINVP